MTDGRDIVNDNRAAEIINGANKLVTADIFPFSGGFLLGRLF